MFVDSGMSDLMKPLTGLGNCTISGSRSISVQCPVVFDYHLHCVYIPRGCAGKDSNQYHSISFIASITRLPIFTKPWQMCLSCDSPSCNRYLLCLLFLYVPICCSWCIVGYVWFSACKRSNSPHNSHLSCHVLYKYYPPCTIHGLWFLAPL